MLNNSRPETMRPSRFSFDKRAAGGWEGSFVEPLIIWQQAPDSQGMAFLAEPMINTRALTSLASSESVLDEAAYLADELGLDGTDLPPIDELAARLRELRPEWNWKDILDPTSLRGVGELRQINEIGIYNAAIVVLADRSQFTAGLSAATFGGTRHGSEEEGGEKEGRQEAFQYQARLD